MGVFSENAIIGASAAGGYDIDQSLRFNNDAYLSRTPGSAGNRRTWTLSFWVKRGMIANSANHILDVFTDSSNRFYISIPQTDKLDVYASVSNSAVLYGETTAVFRDPASWAHYVCVYDSTDSTAADRFKVFANGVRQDFTYTNTPSLNQELSCNSTTPQYIGAYQNGASNFYEGYLAEVNFIDGTALDASYFGETEATTGQWIPKKVSGVTYGTNGFYLPFSSTELANSFTDSSKMELTFTPTETLSVDVLLVGGGGGGQSGFGGGGGGGGIWNGTSHSVSAQNYSVVVGTGGQGGSAAGSSSAAGGNTTFDGKIAYGGGGTSSDRSGGSGQGAGEFGAAGSSTQTDQGGTGYGNDGGTMYSSGSSDNPGGGGGAGAVGGNGSASKAGDGGAGQAFTITGSSVTYGGGGGGGSRIAADDEGSGGSGGGGNGAGDASETAGNADQVLDSPTNNFATLNPLIKSNGTLTYSEGNLKIVAGSNWNNAVATISAQSGKWYMEFLAGSSNTLIGVIGDETERWWNGAGGNPQDTTTGQILYYGLNGNKRIDGSDTSYGNSYTDGDIIGIALNLDDSEITFYKNGTAQNSGTAISFSGNISNSSDLAFAFATYSATSYANFGQDSSFAGAKTAQGNGGVGEDFYYTPPTGYKSLATKSLDDPAIALPTAYFNTVLYTGNGSNPRSITGVGFQPDFHWRKKRNASRSHNLHDVVRGAANFLYSDATAAEVSTDGNGTLSSFDSDGFTFNSEAGDENTNNSGDTYVAWNWKAGGTAVSNGNGTITSSVSANSTVGFSIVSYTGQSAAGTVGHGLSQAPEMIILKNRDQGVFWAGYVEALGNTKSISLNDSGASYTEKTWNDTSPTSTVFSIGAQSETSSGRFNVAGEKFIAYCFHSVEGYSKVGSYDRECNSTDGTFYLSRLYSCFFLLKNENTVNWKSTTLRVTDTTELVERKNDRRYTNDAGFSAAATTIDLVSNGVKMRTNDPL
jgi:hypothetical protein